MTRSHISMKTSTINELLVTGVNYCGFYGAFVISPPPRLHTGAQFVVSIICYEPAAVLSAGPRVGAAQVKIGSQIKGADEIRGGGAGAGVGGINMRGWGEGQVVGLGVNNISMVTLSRRAQSGNRMGNDWVDAPPGPGPGHHRLQLSSEHQSDIFPSQCHHHRHTC